MQRLVVIGLLGGLGLNGLMPARAAESPEAAIEAILEARFQGADVVSVTAAPWKGWYEVATASELLYTNADASLVFTGRVIDTASKEDLTAKRWSELRQVDVGSLPLERAITVVRGSGRRQLIVFADPDCPFCQKLESEMEGLTDITIHTFLFPLEDLHPGAKEKARNIWCADDRAMAWTAWMVRKQEPAERRCSDDPVPELHELGKRLKVVATPTLILADGRRIDGLVPLQELENAVDVTAVAGATP